MAFFNTYNRFIKTGLGSHPNRLNYRYQGIIEWNREIIKDSFILDIGAHDGRWAYAAIEAGAKHVTCIEPRESHVKNLKQNMAAYNAENYSVIQGDVHNELPKFDAGQFDLIFCLGFFYHTIEQGSLMKQFKRLNPKHIIFDTDISKLDGSLIELRYEDTSCKLFSVGEAEKNLIGFPTIRAVQDLCEAFGFKHEIYNYQSEDHQNSTKVYIGPEKSRITLRATLNN